MRARSIVGVAFVLSLAPMLSFADSAATTCTTGGQNCAEIGKFNFSIGVGAGLRTNPFPEQRNIPMVLMPQFSYYGRRFFLDNLDVGYTLYEGTHSQISVLATPGYDAAFFNGNSILDALLGESLDVVQAAFPPVPSTVHELDTTLRNSLTPKIHLPNDLHYLGGLEWSGGFGPVSTQLDVLRQAASSAGFEVRAAVGAPLRLRRGTLSLNVGGTLKGRAYVEYYYESYLGSRQLATLGFDPFVTLRYSLSLTRHWRFEPFVQYEHYEHLEELNNSVLTAFVGAVYDF